MNLILRERKTSQVEKLAKKQNQKINNETLIKTKCKKKL